VSTGCLGEKQSKIASARWVLVIPDLAATTDLTRQILYLRVEILARRQISREILAAVASRRPSDRAPSFHRTSDLL
jgi:hypothetical protein